MKLTGGNALAAIGVAALLAGSSGAFAAQSYEINERMVDGSSNMSAGMGEEYYETSSAFDRDDRFYIGAGIGLSELDIDNDNDKLVEVTEDSDTAYDFLLGYSFTNNLAIEAYYADLGTAELGTTAANAVRYNGFVDGELDYQTYGLSGIFSYPILDALRLYLKAGYSKYDSDGAGLGDFVKQDSSDGFHLGVGGEYALTDNLGLRVGYNSMDKADAAYYGANLVYYFGGAEEVIEEPVVAPPPVEVVNERLIDLSKNVYFITDKADLTSSARQALDEAARILNQYPDIRITIAAHTDSRASDSYNLDLSNRRAQSVASYLASRGVAASRMASRGFGESRPIASNKTSEGRAQNRRVEIRTAN